MGPPGDCVAGGPLHVQYVLLTPTQSLTRSLTHSLAHSLTRSLLLVWLCDNVCGIVPSASVFGVDQQLCGAPSGCLPANAEVGGLCSTGVVAFKTIYLCSLAFRSRRAHPYAASGLGAFDGIMNFMAFMASVTNSAMVIFVANVSSFLSRPSTLLLLLSLSRGSLLAEKHLAMIGNENGCPKARSRFLFSDSIGISRALRS